MVVVEELAPKVNQSSACWAPKSNPQPKGGTPAQFGAGGGGGGVGTVGEPELRMLDAEGEPTAWTVGGAAEGKPAKFGALGGCGVGNEGEPELRMLGAEGEPTAWTLGGVEGKPAKFGAVGGGGDGTNGDAELRIAGEGGRENSLHQAAESESCPLESQPFFSFLPWSQQGRCPGSLLYQLLLLV